MRTSASLLRWLPCLLLLSTAQASFKDQLKTLSKKSLFGQEFSNLRSWKGEVFDENTSEKSKHTGIDDTSKPHAYAHTFSWVFGWIFWAAHFVFQLITFGLGFALFYFTENAPGEKNHLAQTLIFPWILIGIICLSWFAPCLFCSNDKEFEWKKNLCKLSEWNYRVWALVIMAVAWVVYTTSYDATVGTNDQATNEIIDKIHIESWLRHVLPMNCGFHWALTLCVPYTGNGHSCVTWFWEKISNHWIWETFSITNELRNLREEFSKEETCKRSLYPACFFYGLWALTTPFLFSGFIFEWMSGQEPAFIFCSFVLTMISCYVFRCDCVHKRSNRSWDDLCKGDWSCNYRVIMMAFMGAAVMAYVTATGRQYTGQQGEEYLEWIFKGDSNEKEYVHYALMMLQWAQKWLGWSLGLNIAFFSIYSCLVPIREEKEKENLLN